MKQNRAYRTAAEMYPLIEEWYGSGLSRLAYCKANQIALHLFAYWHNSYKNHLSNKEQSTPGFIAIEMKMPTTSDLLEIHYPNGNRLVLAPGVQLSVVQQLLQITCAQITCDV